MTNRSQKYKALGKFISILGGAFFILGFLYLIYLAVSFTSAPTTPLAASGQIVPWSSHGTFHYITVKEHNLLTWTMIFCGSMFLCVAVGVYLQRLNDK
jgi:hypothetical protein